MGEKEGRRSGGEEGSIPAKEEGGEERDKRSEKAFSFRPLPSLQ